MSGPLLTIRTVADELRRLGMAFQSAPGEYRVNYRGGSDATAYFTEDLADALATGRQMAERAPPPPLPPIGPVGRRNTRRAVMYRHNAMIARLRAEATADESLPEVAHE